MTIKTTLCCAIVLGLGGVGLSAGCAVPAYDLFEQSQAELANTVGESCSLHPDAPQGNEVWISEQPEACGDFGICLGIGPDNEDAEELEMCSCRCDGAPGDGPYCACPEQYECVPLVVELGAPSAPNSYAGSYCVPR